MEKPYDIITFGDMCVDLILGGGDIVPRFGQVEQVVEDYTLEMGGSTCIFACQAARLGLRTGILGKVGPDGFGRLIVQRLQDCGVDIQFITTDPSLKTGLGVALCKDNDRAILTYLGSLNALTPHDVNRNLLATSKHLHHGSYFLLDKLRPSIPDFFHQAKALGISTSLDTNWDPDEAWDGTLSDTLAQTDIFMPNLQELLRVSNSATLEAGIAVIHAMGPGMVVVKLGERGACVSDSKQIIHCQVEPVRGGDSIGAGDSFDAGFLAGWLRGLPLSECVRLACGCGRAVASKVGGLAGQPNWENLQKLVDDIEVSKGYWL